MSSVLMSYVHRNFGSPSPTFKASGRVSEAGPAGTGPSMLVRFVYCDDILIFSKTREENLAHVTVRKMLETLWRRKLHAA